MRRRLRYRLGRWRDQGIALGWLVSIWILLWGDVTWGNLLGGLLVGGAVLVFFPLPPVTFGGRLRVGALLAMGAAFAVDLVRASLHVAAVAVRPGPPPRSAIMAVPLRVHTDLNLALTAEVISLVPGTLIIDVDREAAILYVHVLDLDGTGGIEANRERVLAVERGIVRAVGSATELNLVTADRESAP
ncbi:Na+/H+ antiporter subunit E [Micromonospora sp. NPDC000207]|uniref:Na+/H+ antiporter subunit E n=1 Tax=Micromonospora sp. NPDC000207 TaxID=3154246 RepID=UPI00331945D8